MTESTKLSDLKTKATAMGVTFRPNISEAKLQEKIDAVEDIKATAMSKNDLLKAATRLIRVRVSTHNPAHAVKNGLYVSVGNAVMGKIAKFAPFDVVTHLPHCLVEQLKSRKYAKRTEAKNAQGDDYVQVSMLPEFVVEVLPPLTKKDLKDLANQQALRQAGE